MLDQVVLPDEALATVGPIARVPAPGVDVPVCVQMGFLTEPFATVIPIADIRLVCGAALVTVGVAITRVLARQLGGHR